MRHQSRNQANRNQRGSLFIEFICVAWTMVVVALIGLNCGILMLGAQLNSNACREAVRAAAEQDSAQAALRAARLATTRFAASSSIVQSPPTVQDGTWFEYQTFPDQMGKPQRSRHPFVKVTTTATFRMPAPVMFNGAAMTDRIEFRQTFSYPLLHLDRNMMAMSAT